MSENSSGRLFEHVRGIIQSSVRQFGLSTTLEMLVQAVADKGLDFLGRRSEEMIPYVKMAWNYEESWRSSYSLEEAISWFKSSIPGDALAGCLFRLPPDKGHAYYRLHHCFVSADRRPLLDGDHPHKVVNAYALGDSLARQFGEKNMLLFK